MEKNTKRIAVAGGTGTAGRAVVEIARERGHDVVVLARSAGVDAVTGEGLRAALEGVDVVIDVLSIQTLKSPESETFYTTTTRNLLAAEKDAGVVHHLALSIVNCDRAPYDYYAGKVAQERLVEQSPVPWTILRAAQFHEFAELIFRSVTAGPVHLAPRMRTQPVAVREVADRLVDLAEEPPAGWARDLAGPREESLVEMVRAYARATGHRGWIPALALPGPFGKAQRDGTLLPGPDAEHGTQTFAEWVGALRGRAVRV